jgi:DNA-binding NtrC family response regulator
LKDPRTKAMKSNKKTKILIVDDSEEMLWAIGNVLEKAGFAVDAVTTGGEALKKIKDFPETKLVLLSYLLPDMSGLSVLRQMEAYGSKAQVIGISNLEGISDSFMKNGAIAFLEKPFDIRELVHVCKRALS